MNIDIGWIVFVLVICVLGWIGFISLLLIDSKFKYLYEFLVNSQKLSKASKELSNVLNNSVGNLANDIIMIDKGMLATVNTINDIVAALTIENKSYQSFLAEFKKKKENEEIIKKMKAEKEKEEREKEEREKEIIYEIMQNQHIENSSKRENGVKYASEQTAGDYDGLKCPLCDSVTLHNKLGQRWCGNVETCGFGLMPREIKSNNENFEKVPFIEENKSIKLESIIKSSSNENTLERK